MAGYKNILHIKKFHFGYESCDLISFGILKVILIDLSVIVEIDIVGLVYCGRK